MKISKAWIKKNIFKIVSIILIILLLIYVPIYAIRKAREYKIYKEPAVETKIYTVWHIETFEGGGKSRIDYLKAIASDIEDENDGILFMIKKIEPESLETMLTNSTPDIISFGYGVGKIVLPYLVNLDKSYDARDQVLSSGMFNNKIYALPYIVSGYANIIHNVLNTTFYCGQTPYTHPEIIYNQQNQLPNKSESQYEAYKSFVYDKDSCLLGTARDVFRVNNLNKIGRANAIITPVDSYTDLIQYVGITNVDEIITQFCAEMMSSSRQSSLVDYSLFSALNSKLYHDGIYSDMENALMNARVPNVFE